MKSVLITGTDTNVGKTWISCLILRNLISNGHSVGAYKPVCSGANVAVTGEAEWSDVNQLSDAINCDTIELVCPQRFIAAVAPNVAAEMEGRTVDDELLVAGFHKWKGRSERLLVEGAGGLCCPLSNNTTVADLAQNLKTPIVIVAANRLGVINHTLLSAEVAKQRSLKVVAIILNETSPPVDDDESRASNLFQLQNWLPDIPVLSCDYGADQLISSDPVNLTDWFA